MNLGLNKSFLKIQCTDNIISLNLNNNYKTDKIVIKITFPEITLILVDQILPSYTFTYQLNLTFQMDL